MKEILENYQKEWDKNTVWRLNLSEEDFNVLDKIVYLSTYIRSGEYIKYTKRSRLKRILDLFINRYFVIYNTYKGEHIVEQKDKHRSIQDIYIIVKNTSTLSFSLQELIFALIDLVDEGKIHTMYCGVVGKRVFRPGCNERNYSPHHTSKNPGDIYHDENETRIPFVELTKYKKCIESK